MTNLLTATQWRTIVEDTIKALLAPHPRMMESTITLPTPHQVTEGNVTTLSWPGAFLEFKLEKGGIIVTLSGPHQWMAVQAPTGQVNTMSNRGQHFAVNHPLTTALPGYDDSLEYLEHNLFEVLRMTLASR